MLPRQSSLLENKRTRTYGKIYLGIPKANQVSLAPKLLAERNLNDRSSTAFIRGLLENAGADINPLRIIRRIKDDLEVPGLKDALIKILQASNLQVSLLEGCQRILSGDTSAYATELQHGQSRGAFATGEPPRSSVKETKYSD
jgi:hypothetical protein